MRHSYAMTRVLLAGSWLLAATRAAATECAEPHACAAAGGAPGSRSLATASADVQVRVGNAVAPFHQARFPEVRSELGEARIATLAAGVAVSSGTSIVAVIPWVSVGVLQPAGSHLRTSTLANPTLGVRHTGTLREHGAWRHELEWFGGVTVPLASASSRGAALDARALALAAALESWTHREAYAPGALSLVPAARLRNTYEGWLELSAAVKTPLLFRIRASDSAPQDETRDFGLLPTLEVAGHARLQDWLSLSLASSLAVSLLPLEVPVAAVSDLPQLAMAPKAILHLHDRFDLDVDLNLPVGGPLWGTFGIGLALRAEL